MCLTISEYGEELFLSIKQGIELDLSTIWVFDVLQHGGSDVLKARFVAL